jgi:signal peptidase I
MKMKADSQNISCQMISPLSDTSSPASRSLFLCIYSGKSMYPTIVAKDILEVVPYDVRPIQIGDVIVFSSPDDGTLIAHRIIYITKEGVLTKGDNNPNVDDWLLKRDLIIGQVIAFWRNRKRYDIREGIADRFSAKWTNFRSGIYTKIIDLARPCYHFVKRIPFPRGLFVAFLRPKIAVFESKGKISMTLLLGGAVIGRYDSHNHRWQINKLYRFFINESDLPPANHDPEKCFISF